MTQPPTTPPPIESDPAGSPSEVPTVTVTGRAHSGDRAFSPRQVLGDRNRIRAFLGEGGMGEVWHPFDLRLRVDVALNCTFQSCRPPDLRPLEVASRRTDSGAGPALTLKR